MPFRRRPPPTEAEIAALEAASYAALENVVAAGTQTEKAFRATLALDARAPAPTAGDRRPVRGGDDGDDDARAAAFASDAAEVAAMVQRRVTEMLVVVNEETANLARYRVALRSFEGETEDVVGAITAIHFERVHDRFYDLVLRADLGTIDIAWAKREDHRLRIDSLTRERARELQALDDEFRDVMDLNQGVEGEP